MLSLFILVFGFCMRSSHQHFNYVACTIAEVLMSCMKDASTEWAWSCMAMGSLFNTALVPLPASTP